MSIVRVMVASFTRAYVGQHNSYIILLLFITEVRLAEMSSMGIGNKPCLDIRPSADQINDRSITFAQLSKSEYDYFLLLITLWLIEVTTSKNKNLTIKSPILYL